MLLINATNIKVGGGLQVAMSVVQHVLNNDIGCDVIFAVSSSVYKQLENELSDSLIPCKVLDLDPKRIQSIFVVNRELYKLLKQYNVNKVFSIFGPTFWNPKTVKHLVGFANAWLVSDITERAYSVYSPYLRILFRLKNSFLAYSLFRQRNVYVTESESVKAAFSKKFAHKKIHVVSNTCSQLFDADASRSDKKLNEIDGFKFVTISHNYPHKNLRVIGEVASKLALLGYVVTFIVTFSDSEYESQTELFKKHTYNLGVVDIYDCAGIYRAADALFLPTLIECFTVSYLEAMQTKTAILTSDLPFARDICDDSAFYFDPYCSDSIVETIKYFLDSYDADFCNSDRVLDYARILSKYQSNADRVDAYVKILNAM